VHSTLLSALPPLSCIPKLPKIESSRASVLVLNPPSTSPRKKHIFCPSSPFTPPSLHKIVKIRRLLDVTLLAGLLRYLLPSLLNRLSTMSLFFCFFAFGVYKSRNCEPSKGPLERKHHLRHYRQIKSHVPDYAALVVLSS